MRKRTPTSTAWRFLKCPRFAISIYWRVSVSYRGWPYRGTGWSDSGDLTKVTVHVNSSSRVGFRNVGCDFYTI